MPEQLPENWRRFFGDAVDQNLLDGVLAKLEAERAAGTVFPPPGRVFHAFELTAPEEVRVVLLGQDPYHDFGQAEGLAFSVAPGVKFPPSLRNGLREYSDDLPRPLPESGSLENWGRGGVLLLNAVLSVRAHTPGSHRHLGWETVTDRMISVLSGKSPRLVFILWGNYAITKKPLIDTTRHLIIESVHPSPLSAHRGFFGSRPFSRAAAYFGDWQWPELAENDNLFSCTGK